ncbi:peroxide stress protein YaaA [Streptococcus massiliensis]|uniref:UPF0246 protein NCTC13765_00538 n=1 Tax=Streptococcus massiliensis TaxID=313439 RepID=A0A380KVZ6_9STRE|nr:peroxide stress protein YaaA [Streptococcus massiliensis]SUN76092.1 YaaA like protein [Streptococcus massiliensis]
MKILIPTAKEMNLEREVVDSAPLSDNSRAVLAALRAYSSHELAQLYKVSPEKAQQEYKNIEKLAKGQAASYPALYLFDGLMYRHIKRDNLTAAEEDYLRQHILITSSLYGVIPALSPISPHRLDFMVKLQVAGQSLKKFWQKPYAQAVAGEDWLLSLLSSEFETVFPKAIRDKMIRVKFLEEKAGVLKVHSTISKKARGQFLTALMEKNITSLEQMKQLEFTGFFYRPDLSSETELVFVKKK